MAKRIIELIADYLFADAWRIGFAKYDNMVEIFGLPK